MIYILDYGMGNLKSVLNAFLFNNINAKITERVEDLKYAEKLVVPGVGAFANAINELRKKSLIEGIKKFIHSGRYYLGICLGMQILFKRSYEFGESVGLGILDGDVTSFSKEVIQKGCKIPHMGWNTVNVIKKDKIFKDINDGSYFYFDHSYASFERNENTAGTCKHGVEFNAVVIKENIIGMQFHPEKSGIKGLKIIKNFSAL
jgi:glutamine amidotransferase